LKKPDGVFGEEEDPPTSTAIDCRKRAFGGLRWATMIQPDR